MSSEVFHSGVSTDELLLSTDKLFNVVELAEKFQVSDKARSF